MVQLFDANSGAALGTLTDTQLDFLLNHLEEEGSEDQDYYLNEATIDLLATQGGDAALIELLRRALGNQEGIDIRWEAAA